MKLFGETVRWKILSFFFDNHGAELYVKELARKAKISPSSVSTMCRDLLLEGILRSVHRGNSIFYSLDTGSPLVKRLKTDFFLGTLLAHEEVWEKEGIRSVVLYGSYAAGEYDSNSAVELLVVTDIDELGVNEMLRPLHSRLRAKVSLRVVPAARWLEMEKRRENFYLETLGNHVLLFGSPLLSA
jgi:predicted nucleotidyltransferase